MSISDNFKNFFSFNKKNNITPCNDVKELLQDKQDLSYATSGNQKVDNAIENAKTDLFGYSKTVAPLSLSLDLIATRLQSIKPIIYNKNINFNDTLGGFDDSDSFNETLLKPNVKDAYSDFIKKAYYNYMLYGNIYILVNGNIKGSPLELYILDNNVVTINQDKREHGNNEIYYEVTINNVHTYTFYHTLYRGDIFYFNDSNDRQIIHIKNIYNSQSNYGDSNLIALIFTLHQYSLIDTHNINSLNRPFNTSILPISSQLPIAKENIDKLVSSLSHITSSAKNTGRVYPWVSTGQYKISGEPFQITNNTLTEQLESLKKEMGIQIYNTMKIPLPLISNEASTFNNYETSGFKLLENGVFPFLDMFFDVLTQSLKYRDDMGINKFITYDKNTIETIKYKKAITLNTKSSSGIYTINELRIIEGLEPIEDGNILSTTGKADSTGIFN